MAGYLITFEGGEGVGKTTQIKNLAESLSTSGHDVVTTREPGGTPAAEEIRALLSHTYYGGKWSPESELLLLNAARSMHIRNVIAPAISQGKIVLSDRYIDSTRVYQGYIQKLPMEFIMEMEKRIVGDFMPHLTIILDLDPELAMERVKVRGATDHYDHGNLAFYSALRNGFVKIAREEPDRCHIIDASRDITLIAQDIDFLVRKTLAL